MSFRIYSALIASLGAVALMLATNEVSARATGSRGLVAAAPHATGHRPFGTGHRPFAHAFRNHRGFFGGGFWPGDDGYESSYGQAPAGVTQPVTGDVHYTTTYDVPWDWAHRLPPQVAPSDRAYVPSCSVEGVTVPGNGGEAHTVNVTRCY